MKTIVALFGNFSDADRALIALVENGFDRSAISFAAQERAVIVTRRADGTNGVVAEEERAIPEGVGESAVLGAGEGVVVGGSLGFAAGIAALMIPGIGPLFAAGELATVVASVLAGAMTGATVGGLAGALTHHGLPADTADMYAERVSGGAVVLSIQTDRAHEAVDILRAAEAVHVYQVVDRADQSGTPSSAA